MKSTILTRKLETHNFTTGRELINHIRILAQIIILVHIAACHSILSQPGVEDERIARAVEA
jgi:hypothetical protein